MPDGTFRSHSGMALRAGERVYDGAYRTWQRLWLRLRPAQGPIPIKHSFQKVNGATLHVAEVGAGRPLLLLHGWPEFWLTWEREALAISLS